MTEQEINLKIQQDIESIKKEIVLIHLDRELIRKDMKLEISQWVNKALHLWMFIMFVLFMGGILGAMAKGFHWI